MLVERGGVPDPLGEPEPARLHVDRAGEGRTPLEQLMDVRIRPAQVEVLGGLADHEHIDASLTDNLVGKLGSVTLDVLRLGSIHAEKAIQTSATAGRAADPGNDKRSPLASTLDPDVYVSRDRGKRPNVTPLPLER